jgi:peptidoglycan/xylan/chitin deacetylase (PgdA/CDA1 family)
VERRTFLGLLAVGAASLAAGGSAAAPAARGVVAGSALGPLPEPAGFSAAPTPVPVPVPTPAPEPTPTVGGIPDYGPPYYQPPEVVYGPVLPMNQLALTIDDGFDAEVVSAYVQLAHDTGIHLTFSPNGIYRREWEGHADVLQPLIEAGQVQIGNHTYSHKDLRQLSNSDIEAEAERNEAWINATFHTSSRPYLRPPFGFHDERVRQAVAQAGFHQVLMWNGSLGDSVVLTERVLLEQADRYVRAGTVLLGHANHPEVTHCYGQILELVRSRDLSMVTLDEMFGTSRPPSFGTVAATPSSDGAV